MLPLQQFLNFIRYSVTDSLVILASKMGVNVVEYEGFKRDLIEAVKANNVSRIEHLMNNIDQTQLSFIFLNQVSLDERLFLTSLKAKNFDVIGQMLFKCFTESHLGRTFIPNETFMAYTKLYGVDRIDTLIPNSLSNDYVWSQLKQVANKVNKSTCDDLYAQRLYVTYFRKNQPYTSKPIFKTLKIIKAAMVIIQKYYINCIEDALCSRTLLILLQYKQSLAIEAWTNQIMESKVSFFKKNDNFFLHMEDKIASYLVPSPIDKKPFLSEKENHTLEAFMSPRNTHLLGVNRKDNEDFKALNRSFRDITNISETDEKVNFFDGF
ncbi:MAG: hypothetical protein VX835_04820 [Pseudomonadota bacterium]|nr:hypothetical protein [Pseudomonadota bacterium]